VPEPRRFVVGCMEFDWVMGCGLGWFVGPKFLLCDGLGWVGLKKLDSRTTLRTTHNNDGHCRRGVRQGFCSSDSPCVEELVTDMDDKLFNCILSDKHHVLYQLLPPERNSGYILRPRKHELCLINKYRLDEKKITYRLLFRDMYWTEL